MWSVITQPVSTCSGLLVSKGSCYTSLGKLDGAVPLWGLAEGQEEVPLHFIPSYLLFYPKNMGRPAFFIHPRMPLLMLNSWFLLLEAVQFLFMGSSAAKVQTPVSVPWRAHKGLAP